MKETYIHVLMIIDYMSIIFVSIVRRIHAYYFMKDDELSKILGVKVCFIVCKLLFFWPKNCDMKASFVNCIPDFLHPPTNVTKRDECNFLFYPYSCIEYEVPSSPSFYLSSSLETCTDNFSPHDSI